MVMFFDRIVFLCGCSAWCWRSEGRGVDIWIAGQGLVPKFYAACVCLDVSVPFTFYVGLVHGNTFFVVLILQVTIICYCTLSNSTARTGTRDKPNLRASPGCYILLARVREAEQLGSTSSKPLLLPSMTIPSAPAERRRSATRPRRSMLADENVRLAAANHSFTLATSFGSSQQTTR